jgi:hypothetical protein
MAVQKLRGKDLKPDLFAGVLFMPENLSDAQK